MHAGLYTTYARAKSHVMLLVCILFTFMIVATLGLVCWYLGKNGITHLGVALFTKVPTGNPQNPGGMLNGLTGTAILLGLASVVGIPLGMFTGIYLSEYQTEWWLASPVRFICDVLTGVPSIVVGILGYELLVVRVAHRFNGYAGAMALAFIMVPIVARTTEEMLRLVPRSYREASIALGASKAATILRVVVPAATGSIITGIMLAIARVAGETAPLLFTALGSRLLTLDPKYPFPSLTVQIFDYARGAYPKENHLAWAGMLVLISLIFIINLSVRYFARSSHSAH